MLTYSTILWMTASAPDLKVIVAALETDMIISVNGQIPWNVIEDKMHFWRSTLDACVIMGRKTWDSLPKKPLPHRLNIVISHTICENVVCVSSLDEAINCARKSGKAIWVMGGESIYTALVKHPVHRMMIEKVVITKIAQNAILSIGEADDIRYFPMKEYQQLAEMRGHMISRVYSSNPLIEEYLTILYNSSPN
jgi:dihydrofolate reductase